MPGQEKELNDCVALLQKQYTRQRMSCKRTADLYFYLLKQEKNKTDMLHVFVGG